MYGRKIIDKRQDRLMAFFDAVMAIAMTVLALEITVPHLSAIGRAARYDFFGSMTCYLISFVAMSTLWYIHNNFFSNHDLTGNNSEIVMHLVLLFVITLFQPLTRAIGQYPDDNRIRAFYLIDFVVMYGMAALIMVTIRRREDRISGHKAERMSALNERRKAYEDEMEDSLDDEPEEARRLRRMLQLAYAIENPEEIQKKLAEYMPDDYKDQLNDLKKMRNASYHMSLNSVFVMAVAVFVAVVTLIFSVWWSYAALAVGLLVIFLMRIHWRNYLNKTMDEDKEQAD